MNTTRDPRDPLVLGLGATLAATAAAAWLGYSLLFGWGVSLILTLTAALGAMKRGRLGPFKWFFAAALLVWLAAFALMHILPADPNARVLGLPYATAVLIYGLWLLPPLVVTLPYAFYFERFTFDETELRAFEALRRDRDGT